MVVEFALFWVCHFQIRNPLLLCKGVDDLRCPGPSSDVVARRIVLANNKRVVCHTSDLGASELLGRPPNNLGVVAAVGTRARVVVIVVPLFLRHPRVHRLCRSPPVSLPPEDVLSVGISGRVHQLAVPAPLRCIRLGVPGQPDIPC